MESNHTEPPKIPYIAQLLLLVGLFITMGVIFAKAGAYLAQILFDIPDINAFSSSIKIQAEYPQAFLLVRTFETIGGFIIPALIFPLTIRRKPLGYYNLSRSLIPVLILLVIAIAYFMAPLIDLSSQLNQKVMLPDFLREIEDWLAEKNQEIQEIYSVLLDVQSPLKLMVMIVVVAILPAIGEELIFRGALQNIFTRWTGRPHAGIWIAAVLFSAIHMQVYLFLPRLLLGALFGYLVYWTRNLWYPIIAHFLNNAFVLVAAYYLHLKGEKINLDEVGTLPLSTSIFFILILFGLIYTFRQIAYKKKLDDELERLD